MSVYDLWLQEPYQRAYAEQDAYVDFCERHELDPDTKESERYWDAYKDDGSHPGTLEEREQDDYLDNLPEPPF